ncbi:hypothetical protein TNCV_1255811 [Trichonephila clavipes]|nr:hypothetical protein TNCV_1255811 [Trichonephila clavipes]
MLEKVIENWTSRLDYIRASRGSHMPEMVFKIRYYLLHLETNSHSSAKARLSSRSVLGGGASELQLLCLDHLRHIRSTEMADHFLKSFQGIRLPPESWKGGRALTFAKNKQWANCRPEKPHTEFQDPIPMHQSKSRGLNESLAALYIR